MGGAAGGFEGCDDAPATRTTDSSDHAPFEWAGFRACATSEYDWELNPCYHRMCDSVDTANYINYGFAADFARSV